MGFRYFLQLLGKIDLLIPYTYLCIVCVHGSQQVIDNKTCTDLSIFMIQHTFQSRSVDDLFVPKSV